MQQRFFFPVFRLPTAHRASFLNADAAKLAPSLPSLPPSPALLFSTAAHLPPQLSDSGFSGFSPDVDQTPVSNTGQVTPSRLAVYSSPFLFFKKRKKKNPTTCPWSQSLVFPILLQLHPVHSSSAGTIRN